MAPFGMSGWGDAPRFTTFVTRVDEKRPRKMKNVAWLRGHAVYGLTRRICKFVTIVNIWIE
jgi:hypothetical protein